MPRLLVGLEVRRAEPAAACGDQHPLVVLAEAGAAERIEAEATAVGWGDLEADAERLTAALG